MSAEKEGVAEETLKELAGAIIDKLIAATPSSHLAHVTYRSTKDAISDNSVAISAMLKDSPTFGVLVRQLSASFGGGVK